MRKPAPVKDNAERYLITYADLMNLLLILFIVLYTMSKPDVAKAAAVAAAIREALGGKVTVTTSAVANTAASSSTSSAATTSDYGNFYDQLIALLKQQGLIDKVDITGDSNEVVISLKDNVLFAPGSAELSPTAKGLMSSIADLMKQISFGQLIIEGHTDSDPIHNAQFNDNLELSMVRAYNVAEVFNTAGFDQKKVLPVGYGDNFPVAPNDTAANKAKNRRVVLTILRKSLTPPDQFIGKEQLINTLQQAAAVGSSSSQSSSSTAASSSKSTSSSKSSSTTSSKPSTSSSKSSSSK